MTKNPVPHLTMMANFSPCNFSTKELVKEVISKSDDGGEFGLGLFASTFLLIVCFGGNVQCIRTIRRGKLKIINGLHHGCASNVIDLVTVICAVSLINGSTTCISQMLSFISGKWTFGHHACKASGFFTNLMSLLIIWYTTLLGLERYFKFVNPAEHSITFSKINVQIIIFGIIFVILSVVSGPIYGWGDYNYVPALRTCTFDVRAGNALTYYVMMSTIYLMFPYIVMAGCCVTISLSGSSVRASSLVSSSSPGFDEHHCDHYQSKKFIWPFALSVVLSFLLQLPIHVTIIGQLIQPDWYFSSYLLYTASLMQIFAINCCFSSSVLACNLRCQMCVNFVRCSPWWKIPIATECPTLNGIHEEKDKAKDSSACRLCLQLNIINGK